MPCRLEVPAGVRKLSPHGCEFGLHCAESLSGDVAVLPGTTLPLLGLLALLLREGERLPGGLDHGGGCALRVGESDAPSGDEVTVEGHCPHLGVRCNDLPADRPSVDEDHVA